MPLVEPVPILVKVVDLFGLTMSGVMELRRGYWTAQPIHLQTITVAILRMLELSVQQVSCFHQIKVHICIDFYNGEAWPT